MDISDIIKDSSNLENFDKLRYNGAYIHKINVEDKDIYNKTINELINNYLLYHKNNKIEFRRGDIFYLSNDDNIFINIYFFHKYNDLIYLIPIINSDIYGYLVPKDFTLLEGYPINYFHNIPIEVSFYINIDKHYFIKNELTNINSYKNKYVYIDDKPISKSSKNHIFIEMMNRLILFTDYETYNGPDNNFICNKIKIDNDVTYLIIKNDIPENFNLLSELIKNKIDYMTEDFLKNSWHIIQYIYDIDEFNDSNEDNSENLENSKDSIFEPESSDNDL